MNEKESKLCSPRLPCLLTHRQAGGGGVSGAALAARDATAPVSVPAGPGENPVGPRAHGAQGRAGQHPTRGAAPTARFCRDEEGGEQNKERGGSLET